MKSAVRFSMTIPILLFLASGTFAQSNIQPASLTQDVDNSDEISQLVTGNNEFAMELYRNAISGAEGENVFLSPFSISAALGMTCAGAAGDTRQEMEDVLHFTLPMDATCRTFGRLISRLSSGDIAGSDQGEPFTLAIANGLWVQSGFSLLQDYVDNMESDFDAAIRNLDFIGNPEESRVTINDWVAEKTAQKILDLIPPGLITMDTRIVLTNAVYFKANWQHQFEEAFTSDGDFSLEDGGDMPVPMMRQTEFFSYLSTDDCTAIEMDYVGGTASMLILLPDGSLEDLEDELDADYVQNIRRRMSYQNVALSMPKFEFTKSISLNQVLIDMGMRLAFTNAADFSGFAGTTDLFISAVVHKAFVKVDESGTEAAAATAVVMAIECMPPQAVTMNIDHPFVFFIMDKQTGSILFMGRVMDPSA